MGNARRQLGLAAAIRRRSGRLRPLLLALLACTLVESAPDTVRSAAGQVAPPAGSPHDLSPAGWQRPDRARARSCWSENVTVQLGDGMNAELAKRTIDRLFGTAHGVWLVDELCAELPARADGPRSSRLHVHFVETRPECSADGVGCFMPATPAAPVYDVFVRDQARSVDPDALVFGEYPGNPGCAVLILYRQPESWMAETLYHELLHVWFLNARQDRPRLYRTGHGDVDRCEFEEDFLLLLDAFSRELAALEGHAPERLIPLWKTRGARRE